MRPITTTQSLSL